MINKVYSWSVVERLNYNKFYMSVMNNEIFRHNPETRFLSVLYERLIASFCSEIGSDLEFLERR